MRRIAIAAAVGWGWIVWLGWSLADRRIAICGYGEEACRLRATAARDAVLTHGLTVLLIGVVVVAMVAGGALNRFRRQGGTAPGANDARPLMSDGSGKVWRGWRGPAARVDRKSIALGAAILGLGAVAFAGLDRSAGWVGLGEEPAPEATEAPEPFAEPEQNASWREKVDVVKPAPKQKASWRDSEIVEPAPNYAQRKDRPEATEEAPQPENAVQEEWDQDAEPTH